MFDPFENRPQASDLPALPQESFNEVLRKHRLYLRGQLGGARAVLQYKNLTGLNFHNHDFSQADFTGSVLKDADLSRGVYHSASFYGCDFEDADLSHADFTRADLRGAYLSGADMTGTNLKDADMRQGRILQKGKKGVLENRPSNAAQHDNKYDGKTILKGARLKDANLSGLRAGSADFTDADLTEARLNHSSLRAVDMKGANLTDADLTGANLSFADIRNSILYGATFRGTDEQGLKTSTALTSAQTQNTAQQNRIFLMRSIKEHALWVSSLGKKGKRMSVSGHDLRQIKDLSAYGLTAIHATNASFIGMNLDKISMQGGLFDGADFRDTSLENADLRGSSFQKATLTRVNLMGANLARLDFKSDRAPLLSDFRNADLRYANLDYADLRDAILIGADLSHASLEGADLRRADLRGAKFNPDQLKDAMTENAIFDPDLSQKQ